MDFNTLSTIIAGASLAVNRTLELSKPLVNKYVPDPDKSNVILKLLQLFFSFIVATQLPVNDIATFLNVSGLDSRVILVGLAGTIAVGGETVFTILKTVQGFQKSLTPPTVGG